MAEPPPPEPLPRPPLPQPRPPLPQTPSPQIPPTTVPPDLSSAASSTPSTRPLMAEPPPAFPQPPMLPEVAISAAPCALLSTASSMVQAVPPTSPPDHVSHNPRIGDSGEVESGAGASMAEALSEITTSNTLATTRLPQEEDGVAEDGSISLSLQFAQVLEEVPTEDEPARPQAAVSEAKRRAPPPKQQCRPVLNAAPFIVCSRCVTLVQVPAYFGDYHTLPSGRVRVVQCGACSAVLSYSYRAPDRKKPVDLGSSPARHVGGARSDLFSFTDDLLRNSSFDTVVAAEETGALPQRQSNSLHRLIGGYMETAVIELILDGRKEPSNLPFALLKNITDNFSEERVIGQGGFATVYKGVLSNGNIAVKRIKNSHTIDEKLFYREVNSLLHVNHQNIVRFLGFCANTEQTAIKVDGSRHHIYAEIRERLLCFEYMGIGSLQKHIADELRGFEWTTRYQIIKGILKGLHYLHKEKHIIHMDLKPDNILLDYFMVPKITDFGLSRLDDKSQTMSANRCMTLGYCAPEYLHAGRMSFKSDMYSLGVIIMELVTGLKSVSDHDHNSVLRRWRHRWNKSAKETPLLHQQLQVIKCMKIGQLCQEHDPCKRPFISDVIRDLNEMECTDGRIRNANESPIGQISSYAEDDMLGIEPLEIHFTFELNKCTASSLQLNNETASYKAFNIQTTSPLPFCMLPNKGIMLPRSNRTVYITLEPHHEVPQYANELIVRSTKVNNGLKVKDINNEMFNRQTGKVVDEVILDIVFDTHLHMGLSEEVYKHDKYAHFGYLSKRQMFSCGAEKRLHDPIETPQDGLFRPCYPPLHSNHDKKAKGPQHHSVNAERQKALQHHLLALFPAMDPQLFERALEASDYDLDSAIKTLNELRLVSTQSDNGPPTEVEAISTAIGGQSENGLTTTVDPSAKDTLTNEWVDIFVREMMNASDLDDARARASTTLEAMKKSLLDHAQTKAVPDPSSDTRTD